MCQAGVKHIYNTACRIDINVITSNASKLPSLTHSLPNQEDTMEESGWKNVHGDVFRPPQYPMILSSLLGSGVQLFCMILIVICEYV